MEMNQLASSNARAIGIQNRETFDEAFDRLLKNYISVADATARTPYFSITDYILLYVKMILWEISVFALCALIPANLLYWTYCKFSGRNFTQLGSKIIKFSAAPFLSLYHGEIPALKFLTVRLVTRLITYYRLCGVLDQIALRLKEDQISGFEQRCSGYDQIAWHEHRLNLLANMRGILSDRFGYSLLASLAGATGIFGVGKTLYDMLSKENQQKLLFALLQIISNISPTGILTRHFQALDSFLHKDIGIFSFLLVSIVFYSVWIGTTNFVNMRNLLKKMNTYTVERECLKIMGAKRSTEIPFDLIGWVLLPIIVTLIIIYTNHDKPNQTASLYLCSYSLLFVYALYRRIKISRATAQGYSA